jgi:hypothetical protein
LKAGVLGYCIRCDDTSHVAGAMLAMIAIVFVAAAVALIVSSIITLWQLSTTTSDSHAMVARIAGMAPLLLSVSALIYASLFRLPMARPVEASGLGLCVCSDARRTCQRCGRSVFRLCGSRLMQFAIQTVSSNQRNTVSASYFILTFLDPRFRF